MFALFPSWPGLTRPSPDWPLIIRPAAARGDARIKSGHDGVRCFGLEQVPARLNGHSRESGNPCLRSLGCPWTPAFVGVTEECNSRGIWRNPPAVVAVPHDD